MAKGKGFKVIEGSVTAPQGFRAGAVFCDIKKLGTGKGSNKGKKRDLAILVSDAPCSVAGMFTTSQVCAAPVKVSAKRAAQASARGVVVNSGNANACTGKQGLKDAEEMTRLTAKELGSARGRRSWLFDRSHWGSHADGKRFARHRRRRQSFTGDEGSRRSIRRSHHDE
jgi:N-acetylglutamate synthase/N-acetylornithine aminotransferase